MPPPPSWIRDGGGGHEGGAVASPLGRANSLASFAIASQQNKDAAIRAGKREQWTWMQHEAIELVRAFEKAGAASLWAWDDLSVSHTKRRVSAIDNVAFGGNFDGVREKIDAGGFLELQITTVSENAEEGLQGLKRTLRKILSVPDGLKLPQAAGGFRDVSEGNLDDALAASLGFESLDVLLSGIPDACRWSTDGTRLEAMREASRHEVHTWALTQGGVERPGLVYVADLNGVVSAVPKEKILLPKTPPARAALKSYLPYDDAVVYEDLTEMSKIHLPSLLHNVEARFLSETIYSYIGNMLIAVNPYKPLTMPLAGNAHPCFIYGREVRAYYASLRGDTRQPGVRAHVFVVADNAFRNLAAERKPQAVVISGESGAGKTKSAREVLRYIVQVSAGALDGGEAADAALKTNGFAEQMVKKITQNNPILEAFGNAKTLRNDNSSRFGKYLELWFDSGGGNAVAGAQIRTYLLEKSRITARNKGERSFHVFYMLLRGLEKDGSMRELLRLKPLKDYAYLGGAEGTFEAESAYEDGKGEAEQWGTLKAALEEMGMGEDILSILRVLSLVLLLGNIQFEETEDHNGSKWSRVARGSAALADAAAVARCTPEVLEEALCIKSESEMLGRLPLSARQAANNRDSLAKLLYAELFEWLRGNINHELARDGEPVEGTAGAPAGDGGEYTIGLLDIFGFESFSVFDSRAKVWRTQNSLEQLCINFANEALQMLFNRKVLESDKQLYAAEFDPGDVPDVPLNHKGAAALVYIELVTAKLGDACREAERREDHHKMGLEMIDNIKNHRRQEPAFQLPNGRGVDEKLWKIEDRRYFPAPGRFVVTHYADDVEYHVENIVEKNLDKGHDWLKTLASESGGATREPLVLQLLRRGLGLEEEAPAAPSTPAGSMGRGRVRLKTVASDFRKQLMEQDGARRGLIPTLERTQMHFVRCVKPNDQKKPLLFERSKVAGQLSSNGVVEAVKLAQAGGLPTRYPYAELWARAGMDLSILLRAIWRRNGQRPPAKMLEPREGVRQILEGLAAKEWVHDGATVSKTEHWEPYKLGKGSYKFGKTMLFLAAGRLGQLMMLRAIELLPYAARLQAAVRGVLDRARYIEMRDAASEFLRTQKARLFIQRWWRSRVAARRRASRTLPFFRDSASAPSKPKLPPLLGAFSPGGKPPPPLQKGGSVKVKARRGQEAEEEVEAGISWVERRALQETVEHAHPLNPAQNHRAMVTKLACWTGSEGLFGGGGVAEGEEGCEVSTAGVHGWVAGMHVRLVVAALGATHALQGIHLIESVPSPDRFIILAPVPPALQNRDLSPSPYAPPSYARRVPATAGGADGHASAGGQKPSWEAYEEVIRAHPRGGTALPLDVPPSLRKAPASAQAFWVAWAPPRPPMQVTYPLFPFALFLKAFGSELRGTPAARCGFGGFALDASSGEAALEPKLRAGLAVRLGAAAPDPVGSREPRDLPVGRNGEEIVPAEAFSRFAMDMAAEIPAASEEVRARFPPWMAALAPPLDLPSTGPGPASVQAAQLARFRALPNGEVVLEPDPEGLADARAHARAGTASRTICVLGRGRAGKSMVIRRLIRSALLAGDGGATGGPALGAGPGGPGGMLVGGRSITAGITSYTCHIRDWGRGYALPVRLIDTEGESDASDPPASDTTFFATQSVPIASGSEPGAPAGGHDGGGRVPGGGGSAARRDGLDAIMDKRRAAVRAGIPRVAYLTCDVLVWVMSEYPTSRKAYQRLLEAADAMSGGLPAGPRAPALLIVSNTLRAPGELAGAHGGGGINADSATGDFFRFHEAARGTGGGLFGAYASSVQTPQSAWLPLRAYFRAVRVLNLPHLAEESPGGASELVVQRLGEEVYRLALAAPRPKDPLLEDAWVDLVAAGLKIYTDRHATAAEAAYLAAPSPSAGPRAPPASPEPGGGGAVAARTTRLGVLALRALFDLASLQGDPRRCNPAPSALPPLRAMHLLWGPAGAYSVTMAALLARLWEIEAPPREAEAFRKGLLEGLLLHVQGAMPCVAHDPWGARGEGMNACAKLWREYASGPLGHARPPMPRKDGAAEEGIKRRIYFEAEGQAVSGNTLAEIQITSATNLPGGRFELLTTQSHRYQAGYLVALNLKGVDPRHACHEGHKRIVSVEPLSFVLEGQVPARLSGKHLVSIISGRSRCSRVNGSFVTDIDWLASKKAFGEAFEEKLSSVTSMTAQGVREEMRGVLQEVDAMQGRILARCAHVYPSDSAARERLRQAAERLLGLTPDAGPSCPVPPAGTLFTLRF